MRRILLMAVASSALLLALPTGASAHHRAHKARHHSRHHLRHHVRVRHFGILAGAKTTSPSSPTPAGTVKSFNEGVLTITLADNSTVSGKVTEDTEIRCLKEGATGGDDQDEHHAFAADHRGDQGEQGDDNEQGDDDQGEDQNQNCTVAALTPGAIVLGAELKLGSSGSVWTDVDVKA